MHALFGHDRQDAEIVLDAIEILDGYGLTRDAMAIGELAIAGGGRDPRLFAYVGMLAARLGQFELARRRYTFALSNHPAAVEWNVLFGLSHLQRYTDPRHPDIALFRDVLQRETLGEEARTTTLFGLAKAYDALGDYQRASSCFRRANTLARTSHP